MNQEKAAQLIDKILKAPAGREVLAKRLNLNLVEKPDAGEIQKPIVAILTPCLDVPEPDHSAAMNKMLQYTRQTDVAVVYHGPGIRGSSIVHWARNYLIAELLKSGNPWTHVLMIDDDIVPPQDALVRLLSQKKDIVAAICTKRQDPPVPNIRWFDPSTQKWGHIYKWAYNNCIEVDGVGTGMMLISRHALEQVAEAYFSCLWEKEHYGVSDKWIEKDRESRLDYFDKEKNAFWFRNLAPLNGGHEWGEDISFCFMATRYCGLKIYCDTAVQPDHVGNYGFGLKDYIFQQEEAIAQAKRNGQYQPPPELKKPDASYTSKISILLPTRGRPENIKRLLESIEEMSLRMPEVVIYFDEDDESRHAVNGLIMDYGFKSVIGPRRTLSECWNECAKVASGEILMQAGDDLVFATPGWDQIVANTFEEHSDKLIFVHGDDGHFGPVFGTHGFLHKRWAETIGYFVPPYFSSDYCDTWLNEVSNAIGRRVYLPIVTEHMHPLFGKGDLDVTHRERLERHKKDDVAKKYEELKPERQRNIEKLKAVILKHGQSDSVRQSELVAV